MMKYSDAVQTVTGLATGTPITIVFMETADTSIGIVLLSMMMNGLIAMSDPAAMHLKMCEEKREWLGESPQNRTLIIRTTGAFDPKDFTNRTCDALESIQV